MTPEQKAALLAAVAKNINVPGLVDEVLKGALDQALEKIVQDSSNPFDNVLKAAIYPTLSAELTKLVDEQWKKLLAP